MRPRGRSSSGEDGDPATGSSPTRRARPTRCGARGEVTDASGAVTRLELDGLDREITRIVDSGGLNLEMSTTYDGAGTRRASSIRGTTRRSLTTTCWRRLTVTGRKAAARRRSRTTAAGLKLTETDRRGVTTRHTYDNLGPSADEPPGERRRSQAWPGAARSSTGRRASAEAPEKDANGDITTMFDLDSLDRVVKETDALRELRRDHLGRREPPPGAGQARQHHALRVRQRVNRVKKTTDPAPFQAQTVVTNYADALNRVTETDRRGTLKVTQMDPLGRVVCVTRDGVRLEKNTYDEVGNKVLGIDGEGKKTQFVYDKANRPTLQTAGFESTDASTTEIRYDKNGNKLKVIDARSTESAPSAGVRLRRAEPGDRRVGRRAQQHPLRLRRGREPHLGPQRGGSRRRATPTTSWASSWR